jgi:YggT family protein
MFVNMLLNIASILLTVLMWLIILQAVLSWLVAFNVLNTRSGGTMGFIDGLSRLLEPLYRPIRKVLPDFGGLDLSPLVVIILIQIIKGPIFDYIRQVTYAPVA